MGAGESGTGAAVLGAAQNWDVFVSDFGKIATKYQDELNLHNIAWEQEQHTEEKILNANCIVKSPGIPDKAPIVQAAKAKGIEIIDELEFAYRYTNAKMIGSLPQKYILFGMSKQFLDLQNTSGYLVLVLLLYQLQ